MAFLLCFFLSLFFEPHPTPRCFLLSVIGLLSLPSWLVICLAFVFQVFVLLLSLVFFFSAGGQTVGRCWSSQRQVAERLRSPACRQWLTPGPRPGWRSRWWSWSSSAGWQETRVGKERMTEQSYGPLQGIRFLFIYHIYHEIGWYYFKWIQLMCFTCCVSSVISFGCLQIVRSEAFWSTTRQQATKLCDWMFLPAIFPGSGLLS